MIGVQDPWLPIFPFIDAFNANRVKLIRPGLYIVVDEIMSGWEGKELKYHPDGCPHVTKIPRKPVPIGMEGKCSCDGESNIMLRIEIQQGKEAMSKMAYQSEDVNDPTPRFRFHTAVTLRCLLPWFGSKRIAIGDSALNRLYCYWIGKTLVDKYLLAQITRYYLGNYLY